MNAKHNLKSLITTAIIISLACSLIAHEFSIIVSASAVTEETMSFAGRNPYRKFVIDNADKSKPDELIEIDLISFENSDEMKIQIFNEYEGKKSPVLLTGVEGFVQWNIDVKNAGLYYIGIEYFPVKGNNSGIERRISINGEVPFDDANSILFHRIWANGDNILTDKIGNEYRPFQVEKPFWISTTLSGSSGFSMEELYFNFEEGENTIRFTSIKEPMAISRIWLYNKMPPLSYENIKMEYQGKGYQSAGASFVLEGQDALYKSDPTLYPISDTSSPITSPTDTKRVVLNSVGGFNWRYPKQWIEWEFNVPKTGLYKIAIRAKQSYNEGTYSSRSLYINGELPFKESGVVSFPYNLGWQMNVIGSDKEAYSFYLEEGVNTLRLENSLGEIADTLTKTENIVYQLNVIYRRILMVTGAFPDPYRDYHIDRRLPESIEILKAQEKEILSVAQELFDITGSKGSDYARLERIALQIRGFLDNPGTIPERLDAFRINISDLAAWISRASEQPLLVDKLIFIPIDETAPEADAKFLPKVWYEFKMFIQSFFTDYNLVGTDDTQADSSVILWIGGGRDQAQVMKSLTDNYFEPFHDVKVSVKLVDMSALLPAVAAGGGPDFALMQDRTLPVNYALRNALYDMTNFSDYEEVLERFDPSAYESFWIGDSLYAIPETQAFNMLFYRTDIMEELNLQVPETWEDFYNIIPMLQRNSLQIALPNVEENNLEVFFMFLYQQGGKVYNDGKTRAALDTNVSVKAFTDWSELYTKYKLPQRLDATTRFRTGEAPLAIAPFTFYNQLVIAAPEIRGMWDFKPIPGTKLSDGTIDRASLSGGSGAVIFKNSRDKEGSWDFIKWWTSADTQGKYALEIESLQGPAARWPTANLEAFDQLAWTSAAARSIKEQRQHVYGLPELPGSYMLGRYVGTAVRLVINNGYPPRDAIIDFNKMINDEIMIRRQEFGME